MRFVIKILLTLLIPCLLAARNSFVDNRQSTFNDDVSIETSLLRIIKVLRNQYNKKALIEKATKDFNVLLKDLVDIQNVQLSKEILSPSIKSLTSDDSVYDNGHKSRSRKINKFQRVGDEIVKRNEMDLNK